MKPLTTFFFSLFVSLCFTAATSAFDIETTRTFLEKIENTIDWDNTNKNIVYQKIIKKYFAEPNANKRDFYQLVIVYMNNNFGSNNSIDHRKLPIDIKRIEENVAKYRLTKWEQQDYACETRNEKGQAFALVLHGDVLKKYDDSSFSGEEIIYNIAGVEERTYSIYKYFDKNRFVDFGASALICKTSSGYTLYNFSDYLNYLPIIFVNIFHESLKEGNHDDAVQLLLLTSDYNIPFIGLKTFFATPYHNGLLILSKYADKHEPVFGYNMSYLSFIDDNFVELSSLLYVNFVGSESYSSDEGFVLLNQKPELTKECDAAIRNAFETAEFGESEFLPEDSVCHQKILETFTAILQKDSKVTSIFEKKVKRFLEEIEKIERIE